MSQWYATIISEAEGTGLGGFLINYFLRPLECLCHTGPFRSLPSKVAVFSFRLVVVE